ncbi:MAG TPA: isocitrate/isopropylmalate family dehydrogenase, partial [Rhodospirillales bacterium]|nr:isocitrate/isopropylmalate family dehydrogenase [Rhodospirillales bacterium]
MADQNKLLILAGDGIGPEVMAEVRRVIDWLERKRGVRIEASEDLVGGAAIDAHGVPLTDETMAAALAADAVL